MGIQQRKEREKERRRQQILVAAKRVFLYKGFSRTTIEDIANEAELSAGTLYLYFKNKEELFASLSLRILQYLVIRLEEVKAVMENSSNDRLEILKSAMYDVYDFDTASIINMFHLQSSEALRNLSEQLLSEFHELVGKSMRVLTDIFRDGINAGYFINSAPESLANTYWCLFSGVVLWEASKEFMEERKIDIKEALNFAFDLFKRGVLNNPVR
ncbi:MAG: TetR/AcrR family transcriptional regulator [Desulfobacterales bacterium]|jgi:AcrR family transcriptional regulator|nr:TetR/AcrR family transcriptional regulator [Desulfobacterales bacterium]